MTPHVFLTGATGFIGTWIARRLLAAPGVTIAALVRASDSDEATRRLARAWWDHPELVAAIGARVFAVRGDVAASHLGLDEETHAALVRRTTHIVHAAADWRADLSLPDLRRTNVGGTVQVIEFARAVHGDHGLSRLAHVSSAYVCGQRQGSIAEDDLSEAYGFTSAYERSKFEGEALVRSVMAELPVSIFRPGMVVGDSRTGAVKTFNTVYVPLRLYLTRAPRLIPARPDLRLNLVPVDHVADAVVRLSLDPQAAGLTFHLTSPPESLPTVGELVETARAFARDQLGVRLPRPICLPIPAPSRAGPRLVRAIPGLRGLGPLLPYVDDRREFRRDNVDRLLERSEPDWGAILPRLLAYAAAKGFLHRSERTVHEQILFRLDHTGRPITYHDLVEGRTVDRAAADVRSEALAAAAALRAMGVKPGDRVAIVGLNSSRYLALDVAIGLAGAVGVPLYYTSPPGEIDAILAASGARLLFVGAPKVLERVGDLAADLPIVSFCRDPVPASVSRSVIPWAAFLARGAESAAPAAAPVGFGDPATIRYTSGTTGTPKGVVFTHGQLRWMGETMVAILPWTTRTRPARYLSFLPLNHVVEGILAAYAPYYVPAPVDVSFLEDFRDLPSALPRVRPTIFFAVPRVYEKVWQGLEASRIGRAYLGLRSRPVQAVLRPLLRRGLLRRAGLDRCDQLIVGSAPADEDLLRQFQGLGIELHDAYGLTEAPLVTLNREGANRVGTVGAPLPETELRIAEDGEILVRGPQVTTGYFDPGAAPPFRDGWLLTGDLGRLTDDGLLVILGRKKEVIATAYGKKVFPGKVEAMLREIPGVAEAMLVGEARPYCVAVLWTSDGKLDEAAIARQMASINARLSHPEQVRRWAVLPYDLSSERGDLTANLKLRRQVVLPRLRRTIELLYAEPGAVDLVRVGEALPAGGAPG